MAHIKTKKNSSQIVAGLTFKLDCQKIYIYIFRRQNKRQSEHDRFISQTSVKWSCTSSASIWARQGPNVLSVLSQLCFLAAHAVVTARKSYNNNLTKNRKHSISAVIGFDKGLLETYSKFNAQRWSSDPKARVRVPGAAREFLEESAFSASSLTVSIRTVSVCAIARINICARVKTLSHWQPYRRKILHTLAGMATMLL